MCELIPPSARSTPSPLPSYAGLLTYLEKLNKETLVAAGLFNEHTVHVLGEPIVIPEEHRVTVAFSTINLLLNLYRQSDFGVPKFVCVDTTHRLVKEGHCCLLVGTMSLSQHFHIVGYGICSHEDARAHEHILSRIRDAVDAAVQDYHMRGERV